MTGTAASTKKRGRLRKLFSSITTANQTGPSSASHSASTPIPSKLRSSTPPLAQSCASGQSLKPDLGERPASPADQALCTAQSHSTAPLTLGRELLDRALEFLPQRERATIEKYILPTSDDIDSALRKAFNAAQDKRNLCEKKRWTFTFGRHTVRLGDEADKVLLWLDRFKSVGDIAINADPIHAGLPWAGIRLLLEVRRYGDQLLPRYKAFCSFLIRYIGSRIRDSSNSRSPSRS